jgi:hypothetical protein
LKELLFIPVLAVVPLAAMVLSRRWEATVCGVMVLMIFEGALRKWIFPGFQAQIYLLKDLLLLIAFFGFLHARRTVGVHEPLTRSLKIALGVTAAFCFVEIVNPHSPSLMVGLIGFKNYLLYAVLLIMVPYLFKSHDDLRGKLNGYMLLMIPVALLGLVQFFSPPDSFINTYVSRGEEPQSIATLGEGGAFARASSTFSYIGGFSTFVFSMFFLALAFVLSGDRSRRSNLVPIALFVSSILAMFTTGSRAVVFGILGLTPFVLFLCMRGRLITSRVFLQVGVVVLLAMVLANIYASQSIDAFSYRANNSDDPIMRMLSPVTEALAAFDVSPFFGLGIGVSHGSAATIMGTADYWWLQGNLFEVEPARVIQEIGIVGLLLVFGVRLYLLGFAIKMARRLRTPLFRSLSAAIAGFYVLHVFTHVVSNPTAGLFYWFSAGLLFSMYRLDFSPTAAPVREKVQAVSELQLGSGGTSPLGVR